jgi:hypothetical protein
LSAASQSLASKPRLAVLFFEERVRGIGKRSRKVGGVVPQVFVIGSSLLGWGLPGAEEAENRKTKMLAS